MDPLTDPQWLRWARRLQALAQTGLTYTRDEYDRERYEQLRGIAAEMMAAGAGIADTERIVDLFRRETGYATPKIEVRGAVFEKDQVLLVKEREDGCWTIPGGWVDVGETPSAMVEREVREESGYEVVARKLAAVYDRNLHPHPPIPQHAYKMFFVCELVGGAPAVSYETLDVGFFPVNKLPELSRSRVTAAQILHMYGHARHPEWPASFD